MIPAYIAQPVAVTPPARTGFTTPEPAYDADIPIRIAEKPDPWTFDEKQRVRTAAMIAKQRYPGPIGELVCAELLEWADYGWRLSSGGRVMQAVEHLLAP